MLTFVRFSRLLNLVNVSQWDAIYNDLDRCSHATQSLVLGTMSLL